MSRPRVALPLLLFAAASAVVVATGCNPDTRELLLDPRLPVAEPYTGGTWTATPVLTCGRGCYALAAWSRDDALIVGWEGVAVRVEAGVARNVDAPTTAGLTAAVALPDGSALVSAYDGALYRFDGESWASEGRTSVRPGALWRLPDGVVIGVGVIGYGVRRTTDGVWTEFNTGAGVTLYDVWGRAADDCWAVGGDGVVAHFDGTDWSIDHPFGTDRDLGSVTGDADGRVVVYGGNFAAMREGGEWRELPQLPDYPYFEGAVLLSGRLLAWNDMGWSYRWDGSAWVREGSLGYDMRTCAEAGDELLLLSSSGMLARLADGHMETLLPALGSIADFEATPEGAVLLTQEGWIVRETPAGWRLEARLDSDDDWYSNYGRLLVRSAAGDLLALGPGGAFRETVAGWEAVTAAEGPRFDGVFPLDDGSLLLANRDGLWSWIDGRCAFLCAVPDAWDDLRGAAGASRSEARYLFPGLLARFDGAALLPVANLPAVDLRLLQRDPELGLLLAGRGGLFISEDAGTRDITPRCEDRGTVERADILDFTVSPTGDWLAWTYQGPLLRCRSGLWQSLDGAGGGPLRGRWPVAVGRSIRGVGAGDAWLISSSHLFRYRDAAP